MIACCSRQQHGTRANSRYFVISRRSSSMLKIIIDRRAEFLPGRFQGCIMRYESEFPFIIASIVACSRESWLRISTFLRSRKLWCQSVFVSLTWLNKYWVPNSSSSFSSKSGKLRTSAKKSDMRSTAAASMQQHGWSEFEVNSKYLCELITRFTDENSTLDNLCRRKKKGKTASRVKRCKTNRKLSSRLARKSIQLLKLQVCIHTRKIDKS